MTGRSTTTSCREVFDVDWQRDVEKAAAICPDCGRESVQLFIAKWGISPIACDNCSEEWETAEGMHSEHTRATAFSVSGVPEWAARLEPDRDALEAFLHDMGARGVRAKWIRHDGPDAATNEACRLLKAWMESRNRNGAFRSGAYVMETAVYSRDGIGAAASAGMLVIATTLDMGRAGDVVGSVSGEGIAAMEAIIAMMRGAS